MSFTVYRLAFSDPLTFLEQMGDPVSTQGGAPVPALRSALRHSVSLATFLPNAAEETVAKRLALRRRFRSLANNTPMKLTGLYLSWDADPENDGWYLPDEGQLVDIEGSAGLATGVFKIENFVWILAGRPRTHRRAMWVYLKDLRTGLWARDFRRVIYSTDFSGLTAIKVSYFAPGVSDLVATGTGAIAFNVPVPAGEDGGQCVLATGLLDLARVSYEQAEASINTGQVIVYDRRGEQTGPTGGPGAAWEEFYGPDYQYSWVGPAAAAIDTPVLDNGRCRVRWDTAHGTCPGWIIDAWNGSQWEEQGKVLISRLPDLDTELLSAQLVEYFETRAVIQAVMKSPADASSREEVFIILERGWSAPRFEVYPGLNETGERVDARMIFQPAATDSDDSVMKIDAFSAGAIVSTALGTGHTGLFGTVVVGVSTFTGENDFALGRWSGSAFQTNFAVLQAACHAEVEPQTAAYGVSRNAVVLSSSGNAGWLSMQMGFAFADAQQAMEAEGMTLAAGTASTVDAAASGGKAATATRTAEALHVSHANWPNSDQATFRVFARVRTSLSTSKVKLKAKTTTGAGSKGTVETGSETYVWLDLGDVVATNGTLEIIAWLSAAGTLFVDRVEAFLVEDRNITHFGIYAGARDLGQASLYDSRCIPTVVTRAA